MKGRWNTAAVTKAGTVVAMSVPTARRIPRRTKCGMVHDRCSFQESECCRRMVSKSADPVPAVAAFGGGVVVFRWHAAKWSAPTGSRPGSWSMHSCQAYLHRGWKRHPRGGLINEGKRPGMYAGRVCGPSMSGNAPIRSFVYGCFAFL